MSSQKFKLLCYYLIVMGQIIIEIPNRLNRHYQINRELAAELIKFLEVSAVPLFGNPSKTEDLLDNIDAEKSFREYLQTGESHAWKDIKDEFNL